jgi:hypothetical protein
MRAGTTVKMAMRRATGRMSILDSLSKKSESGILTVGTMSSGSANFLAEPASVTVVAIWGRLMEVYSQHDLRGALYSDGL